MARKKKITTTETTEQVALPVDYGEMNVDINGLMRSLRTFVEYTLEYPKGKKVIRKQPMPWLHLSDGTLISVQAGFGYSCTPDDDNADSYTHFEVGYPSIIIDDLKPFSKVKITVENHYLLAEYALVPLALVQKILADHGGITGYICAMDFSKEEMTVMFVGRDFTVKGIKLLSGRVARVDVI